MEKYQATTVNSIFQIEEELTDVLMRPFEDAVSAIINHTVLNKEIDQDGLLTQVFELGPASVEQDHSGGHLHSGEKISGEFVITCGDGTEVFELIEEPFGKVAFTVERKIARSRGLAVGLGRDDRSNSPLG